MFGELIEHLLNNTSVDFEFCRAILRLFRVILVSLLPIRINCEHTLHVALKILNNHAVLYNVFKEDSSNPSVLRRLNEEAEKEQEMSRLSKENEFVQDKNLYNKVLNWREGVAIGD